MLTLPVVKFCLNNIYSASKQDKQYTFSLKKVNNEPVIKNVSIYNTSKQLPDLVNKYNVYIIGNLSPNYINLLRQNIEWYKDVWINAATDMVARNYIMQIYDDNGVMFPRNKIYYSFINESSIIIATMYDANIIANFNNVTNKYIRFYSNAYFNTIEYGLLPIAIGIDYISMNIITNTDKAAIQNWIITKETNGGLCTVFVNGYIYDKMTLLIPNYSYVEVIYDQSLLSKQYIPISTLRQYTSLLHNKSMYLLNRTKVLPGLEYFDDVDIYVTTSNLNNNGVYYYRHNPDTITMVTDKDYGLNSININNLANIITSINGGTITDKSILVYSRKSGLNRNLVYSDLKLHELYKLPPVTQLNVLNGTNTSILDYRVETLENSDYFKIASSPNFFNLTKELCTNALGYNSITYYFGYNTTIVNTRLSIPVPDLYTEPSYAYEYDATGVMLGYYPTSGPVYLIINQTANYVEFIKGQTPISYDNLYPNVTTITTKYDDYIILSADFYNNVRITNWVDITNTTLVTRTATTVSVNEITGKQIMIVYLNEPNIKDITYDISNGNIYFPITINHIVNQVVVTDNAEMIYSNLDIYLNGYRLVKDIDYYLNYPYVSICNKEYLNATNIQNIHIRAYGFNLNVINDLEINGFINSGVLGRNNKFDIRDDRIYSVFINGRFYDRNNVLYAEVDNIVRTTDSLNGLPYSISEPFVSIKQVTGLDTLSYYNASNIKNKRISNFFTLIYPPELPLANSIQTKYVVYSSVISKIIADILNGTIAASVYTNPYDDGTIITLLDTYYKDLLLIDVVKQTIDTSIIEIHPNIHNIITTLNLFQYRFIVNVNRILGDKIILNGKFNII